MNKDGYFNASYDNSTNFSPSILFVDQHTAAHENAADACTFSQYALRDMYAAISLLISSILYAHFKRARDPPWDYGLHNSTLPDSDEVVIEFDRRTM